ncbi:hypothetical protein GCM10025868_24090 [Angustibacter aerolatus]|uniref:Luciferase-like domain-containing protein n=1 Tax=Angustibacter aerolatus TaxID=1162965 RepID=A0ABQ6JII2_9ACTN|nr:hypothetical protein GCM10025868_24090 [Angustibacter aerolatus]
MLALRGLLGEGRATLDGHDLEPVPPPRDRLAGAGARLRPEACSSLAGEVADGYLMLVGLDPASVEAARACVRRGAERAGRDPASLEEVLIVPFGLGGTEQSRAWPRSFFRGEQQWLRYPSASNLHWLRAAGIDLPDDFDPAALDDATADRITDAFGLFGSAEECAERLVRARAELGLRGVFLFPAHTWANHYEPAHGPRRGLRVRHRPGARGVRRPEETP